MDITTKESLINKARLNGAFAARFNQYDKVLETLRTALMWMPFTLNSVLYDLIVKTYKDSYDTNKAELKKQMSYTRSI